MAKAVRRKTVSEVVTARSKKPISYDYPYIIIHSHRRGTTVHTMRTNKLIERNIGHGSRAFSKILKQLNIDFNPDVEYIDIISMDDIQNVKI